MNGVSVSAIEHEHLVGQRLVLLLRHLESN